MMQPGNRYNRGFSLLSLMIASVIGIFIISAAGKVYVDSKQTFNARTAMSAATENGRFAIDDLRRTLVMTGRGIAAGEDENDTDRPLAHIDADVGIYDAGGDADGSDIIAVRYRMGPSCAGYIDISTVNDVGRTVPDIESPAATVRFLVEDDNLVCQADTDGDGDFEFNQPLVSGIKQMRVLYGIDDNSADGYANRYLTASMVDDTTVNPPPPGRTENWVRVVSLRIGLIASSDTFEIPSDLQPQSPQTLDLLGMEYTAPDKDHFYRSFSTTISLRNLNATVQRQ